MARKTANDFHPEVLKLFDQYVHGTIGRRDFLKSAAQYAAVGASASLILDALSPQFASAQQVGANCFRNSIKTRLTMIFWRPSIT